MGMSVRYRNLERITGSAVKTNALHPALNLRYFDLPQLEFSSHVCVQIIEDRFLFRVYIFLDFISICVLHNCSHCSQLL